MKIKIFGADTRQDMEEQVNKWLHDEQPILINIWYTAERNPQKENAIYYSICFTYRRMKDSPML